MNALPPHASAWATMVRATPCSDQTRDPVALGVLLQRALGRQQLPVIGAATVRDGRPREPAGVAGQLGGARPEAAPPSHRSPAVAFQPHAMRTPACILRAPVAFSTGRSRQRAGAALPPRTPLGAEDDAGGLPTNQDRGLDRIQARCIAAGTLRGEPRSDPRSARSVPQGRGTHRSVADLPCQSTARRFGPPTTVPRVSRPSTAEYVSPGPPPHRCTST